MQGLIKRYKDASELRDGGDIPALHGLRFLMVFFVAAFHIWQQSWLTPGFVLFGKFYSLDPLLRSGYMWVDGMLLLSGFLCYLPFAWARENAKPSPAAWPFYKKRLVRILPSYVLNLLLVLFIVVLPQNQYRDPGLLAPDMAAHLTFTHTLFRFSYYGSPLNGALWTLGVEMQFYLLMPLLGRAFRKMPLLTYVGMAGGSLLFRAWAATQGDTSMYFNQLPAFLDVYANGFVMASAFVSLRKRMKEDAWTRVLMTVCAVAAVVVLSQLVRGQAGEGSIQRIRLGQMERRYLQSLMTGLALLGFSLGLGGLRVALGNPVTRFLSAISFQFYMIHQVLAVQLKHWGIPASSVPNPAQAGDRPWQRLYVFLAIGLSLLLSAAITYLFEQPIARRLLGARPRTNKR